MSEATLDSALVTLDRPTAESARRLQRFKRTMRHNPDLLIGSVVVALVLVAAIFAPWLAKEELSAANLTSRLMPPFWLEGGLDGSLLGTDQLGRDLFTRIIYGARTSLMVALVSVFVTALIGVLIGTISGYFGGKADTLLMRFVDLFLAFPGIILTIIILSVLGSGVTNIILVLAVTQWVGYARLTRGMTLSLKHREFIESARASGAGNTRIILRHILPNCMTPISVLASLQVAGMILIEASLSFLGFGVQPPTPSWGIMVAEGRQYLDTAWWISTIPGITIVITVLGIKFLSDGMSSAFDPRTRR